DRLVPLDDAGAAIGIFTTWAKIRAGRRKPETNTLIARKPVADTGGADAWRARISVAAPPAEAEDGSLHILIHIENTGRAYWPAPTGFPYAEGIVNVAPYVLVNGERVELPRVTLPHSLPIGGAVTVALIVPAEHRGRDEVLVDLVREHVGWFSEPASPIARVRLAWRLGVVVDVTPLFNPLTGIGWYWIGMLDGLVRASEGRHEVVAFSVSGPRRRRPIARALDGLAVERRLVVVPPSASTWRR